MKRVQIEQLESRVLLAATPAQVVTPAMRETLVANLAFSSTFLNSLKYKLRTSNFAAFDQQLLDYMRNRDMGKFFFDADAGAINSYVSYIKENLNPGADVFPRADRLMDNLYPEQDGGSSYSLPLPDDIDWDNTGYSTNPETIHALNRHSYWEFLATAHRLTGEAAYADKIIGQLADWSVESPALADPNDWEDAGPQWSRLSASVRGESWTWTYSLLVSSPNWTKEANTLFLAKILEHGQFLHGARPAKVESNHATSHAQGLLYISQLFPEFSAAGAWETRARNLLFQTMDAQFYDDGSHVEQSPGYAGVIIGWLLESKQLERNGDAWPAARSAKLTAAVDAYHEILSPNGNTPAIGDTYRRFGLTLGLKANLALDESSWPAAKPRTRDAWLFGPDAVQPFESHPSSPSFDERSDAYALRDSGNYIMRSGSDADARQINFDAGPKGGGHGHFDLLSFELSGYGRPLIADPGAYRYDSSAGRTWAISTPAHNTVSIDGLNHRALEGRDNEDISVDAWRITGDFVQVSAHHNGYANLAGAPVVSRSIWYDYDDTMLVVDWVEGSKPHNLRSSFLIPGTSTTRDLAAGWIRSTNDSGGNVRIQALLQPGQSASYKTSNVFTSNSAPPNHHDPATQFFVYQTASIAVFATLITTYDGTSPPNVTASFNATPRPGKPVLIHLNNDGDERDISFTPPAMASPVSNGSYNDIAFDDRGRLHVAYFDRATRSLNYAVRGTDGKWSAAQTIDSSITIGQELSLAIDGDDRVGVAYKDAVRADLKFAFNDGDDWRVETVDARGSTGHYPSLAFGRNDEPAISYYDKNNADLRLATRIGARWTLATVDMGNTGSNDVGRFSSLALDPSRPDESNWAIVYEDTGGGRYLYGVQGQLPGGSYNSATGYTTFTVSTAPRLGGSTSLAFDSANRPHVSFYDSSISGLRYAKSASDSLRGVRFTATTVAENGAVGYYSNLFFDNSGRPNIFYFDRTNSKAMRAIFNANKWSTSALASGGREIHVARFNGTVAFTNLNEAVPELEVLFV